MRRTTQIIAFLVGALVCGLVSAARASDYLPGEVLVQLRPGANINLLSRDYGLTVLAQSSYNTLSYRLRVGSNENVDSLVGVLRALPEVKTADPNLILATLGIDGMQWTSVFVFGDGSQAYVTQSGVAQVNYQRAAYRSDGAGVTVAVLDTGISPRHGFLAARMVAGWDFVEGDADADDIPNGLDDNGNGIVDEGAGHGTIVAGLVHRFAPAAWLMPVRVLNSDGAGMLWNAVEGLRFAVAHQAEVINLSFGSPRNSGMMTEAINDAYASGAVIVVAAGNNNSATPMFPAGHPYVLTVAALNHDKTKASFSNYGAAIDVDAPGVSSVSTYWDGRYASVSGTSFACPVAAAEAALIRSLAPHLSGDEVRSLIMSTSISVDPWNPNYLNQLGKKGAGLIDIDAALSLL